MFVSNLLDNIHTFAKLPPTNVIYAYKVWQPKYDEIQTMGVNFMEDSGNIIDEVKSCASRQPMLVVFDDLIDSSSLKSILICLWLMQDIRICQWFSLPKYKNVIQE